MSNALLVIDMQNDFIDTAKPILERCVNVIRHCHYKRIPVFHIHSLYEEYTESNINSDEDYSPEGLLNKTHTGKTKLCLANTDGIEIINEIKEVQEDYDMYIQKRWYSAFKDTDLASELKMRKIKHIYVTGVTTNVCVMATALDATKRGFKVTVINDCTNAFNDHKTKRSLEEIAKFGSQISSQELIDSWTTYGEGDTKIIYDVVPVDKINVDFEAIKKEINWLQMYQQGKPVSRLFAVQGTIENDLRPLYRKPADALPEVVPWTPILNEIRKYLSGLLGKELNHGVAQLYRTGEDHIGDHADKTLDIERGSAIVNYSVGRTRYMTLKTKVTHQKENQKINMFHNSVVVLGWDTNKVWQHSVRPDLRPDSEKFPDELEHNGERISIVFRTISTFIDANGNISGQGAPKDTTVVDEQEDALNLVKAFSKENYEADFDWDHYYGRGFKTINLGVLNK